MGNKKNKKTNKDFLGELRKELMLTQNARLKLTLQKLLFITGLLTLGSFFEGKNPAINPLLLAPIISIVFDLFIEGENFGIPRIGIFLKLYKKTPKPERIWETVLNMRNEKKSIAQKHFPRYKHRDIFVMWANPFATLIVYYIILVFVYYKQELLGNFAIWYAIIVIFLLVYWLYSKAIIMKNRLNSFEKTLTKTLRNEGLLSSLN